MTFIKNKSLLSLFLTFTFLSSPSVAMNEEDLNQKSILTHQKNLPIGVPIGSIVAFAGDKEPEGWLMCDGLPYSSKKYPKLYEIIKENYLPSNSWVIEANKISTEKFFHVPDSRGRVLVGVDNGSNRVTSNNTLGATGGEEKHQLTIDEMPKHNHKMFDSALGEIKPPHSAVISGKNLGNPNGYGLTEETGNDQPHNNMQPYLISNYIIKAKQDEIVQLEKEIKVFKPLPLKPIKTSESLPTQNEFENNYFSEKTLILYKQISFLNERVEKLQQQMNPLIQENENLKISQRGCAKAWIVFDGSNPDTLNSIGVKSVTRHGLGDYTINFSTPFNSENYCPIFHTWRKEQFGILLVHAYSMKSENREINTRDFYRFTVTQIQDNGLRTDAFVSAAFYGN